MRCFKLKERVSVFWSELGCRYEGTICKIYEDDSYDVSYDEPVDGKLCLEKKVNGDRIEGDEDYFHEVSEGTGDDISTNSKEEYVKSSAIHRPIVQRLLKVELTEDIEDSVSELSNLDLIEMNSGLTGPKINELHRSTPDKLDTICLLIVQRLSSNDESVKQSIVDSSVLEANDTVTKCSAWLAAQKSVDDSSLSSVRGSICGATALLRVLSFSNSIQFNRKSAKGVNGAVSEEVVERAIHLVHSFLNTNIITAGRSTTMKEEPFSGKMKGKAKISSETLHRKLVGDVCKTVFPLISSFVSALECLLSCSKQTDRISIGAYELGFLLLKVDPASNAFAEQFNSIAGNVLVATQKTAISMLRVLFVGYSHRQSMLVENLSLLSLVYSAKHPSKLYPLHFSSQTIGDSGRHASVSFIALLTCLQSVVDVSGGLSSQSVEGSCELSQVSLKDCKQWSTVFATELIKRCTHREASADYRNLANCLLNELFATALLPTWPICSILLEQLTLRVIAQLNNTAQDGKQTADGGNKRDNALVVFLLDLLGTIAVGLRKVVLVVDREVECANNKQLAAVVKEAVRNKIDSLKPTWFTYLTKPAVSSSSVSEKKEKKGPKKGGKSSSPDRNEDASQCLIETNKALAILAEISSFTVDAVAEQPMHGEVATTSSLLALVPPPQLILEQVGGQEDLIRKLPAFAMADLHYVHIYNHLSQLCDGAGRQSRHKSSTVVSDADVTLPESSADDHLRDARDVTLSMWHQHADFQRRGSVSAHVLKLLNLAVGATGEKESKSRGDAYFYSAKEEYAWRGNYSLESILGNIRYVVNERLLYSLFQKVLDRLLVSLEDSAPAIRAKVLKLMTVLLQHDAELIRTEEIRRAITLRLEDRAISVREEAVKLVGGYIVRGIDLGGADYLEGLKLRLSADDGISVRKSVVNIFREILLNQPNHPQYATLCLLLLKQGSVVKEEDSIKDIVRMTFQTIWFLPPSVSAAQSNLKLSNLTLSSSSHVVEADSSYFEMEASTVGGDVLSPSAVVTPSRKRGLDGSSRGFTFDTPTKSRLQMLPSGWTQQPKTPSVISETSADPENFLRTNPEGDVNSLCFVSPDGQQFDSFEQAALACGLSVDAISNLQVPPSPSAYSVPHTPSGRSQRVKNSIALGLHVDSTAIQLVDMISQDVSVSNAGNSVHEWIISLLREVLHNKTGGDEANTVAKQRRSASHLHVEKIVSSLVELLLRTEENDQQVARYLAERNRGDRRDYIVSIIMTISLLCEAHPPFIAKHLKTLLPYLKGDSNYSKPQSSLICLKVTGILASTAVLERSALQSMDVSDVIVDLLKIVNSTGPENISAAINCLAVLVANVTFDAEPLYNLARTMFTTCRKFCGAFSDAEEVEGMMRAGPSLQRPVMVLGFVCEHLKKCSKAFETFITRFSPGKDDEGSLQLNTIFNSANADDEIVKRCHLLDITYLHPSAIFGAAYAAVAYTLTVPHLALQGASAKALCGVFIGHPRLMLACQDSGLLVRLLGGGSEQERFNQLVHERFVEALRDMMAAEETRLEQQAALSLMKESGTAILPSGATVHKTVLGPVEAESDSSITGFVLQQHLPMLCVFLSSESDSLRAASLKLVGTLLRQGMLCPLDVMSPLVAFQGDPDRSVREESLRVIQIEDSRHPTFLDNRLLEGVESTVGFQVRTLGRPSATICVDNGEESFATSNSANRTISSVFGALYLSCIQGNKKRKIDFLYGLLRRTNNIFVGVHETFAKCASSFESHFITVAQAAASAAAAALQLQMEQDAANGVESSVVTSASRSGPLTPSRVKPLARTLNSGGSRGSVESGEPLPANELTRLVSTVSEATHKLLVVDFMSLTLAYLPYESLTDPLHAIYWINRNCVLSASSAVERLRQCLLLVGAEMRVHSMQPPAAGSKPNTPVGAAQKKKGSHAHPESDSDLLLNEQLFLDWYNSSSAGGEASFSVAVRLLEIAHQAMEVRSKEAALRLKYFLKSVYNITDIQCVTFNPDEKAAAAGTSSTVDKALLMETDMTYSSSSAGAANYTSIFTQDCLLQLSRPSAVNAEHALSIIRAVVADHNRISVLLHSDPDDFTLVSGAAVSGGAVKRKRATKSSASGDNDEGSVTSAGKATKGGVKKTRTPSKNAVSNGGGSSAKKRSKGKSRLSDSDEDRDFYSDEDSVVSGASSVKSKGGGVACSSAAGGGGAVSVRAKRASAARKSINYVDEFEDVDEPPPGMDM